MAVLKCKMCGGDLNIIEGVSTAECEFCGSIQTIPKVDDEKKLTLFARANRLRASCEFDKAAGIYESIVADFPEEAEAYWGLVLCKYGIEYVDDPTTGKKIPTCHRSSFDSIMDGGDFEQVLENADSTARRVYREEAKQIEEIRKGIIAVSANEEPYDIFICYKETDENGDRTLDSVLAQDVYDALTDKGYRVFFSRITLEDKLGVEYEPYIFAALNSAKIMLAFGTNYEYFNAVWVKNEWSRFLKLMEKNKSKHLIPCFKGIDAYDMPKEFARLQAQDLGKVGATQDLLRGVEKLLPGQKANSMVIQEKVVVQTAVPQQISQLENLLKRGELALEDENWDAAKEFFNHALNIDAECGSAYFGLEMATKKCSTPEKMGSTYPFYYKNYQYPEVSKTLQRARQFAGESVTAKLAVFDAALQKTVSKIEEQKREKAYHEAVQLKQDAKTYLDYQNVANHFLSAAGYLDAEESARECAAQAELIRKKLDKKKQMLAEKRKKTERVSNMLYARDVDSAIIKLDGTVAKFGYPGEITQNLHNWSNIVAFRQFEHDVGLKSDGSVVAEGKNEKGQCNVSDWENIVAIAALSEYTVGLKSDGTVVAVGANNYGGCDVSDWEDIIAISAGCAHTVGLKSDGTVVAAGVNDYGECDVSNWEDIVAISAGYCHTLGLKSDGMVVAVGNNEHGECDVSSWENIIAISADCGTTIGLKADGTVVATGYNDYGQCDGVKEWNDILAVFAGASHFVGIHTDGSVVAVGDNSFHQCEVSGWQLFDNIESIEQERKEARILREQEIKNEKLRLEAERKELEERQQRRIANRCQYCGGELKGFFSKKCVSCGKPKDY